MTPRTDVNNIILNEEREISEHISRQWQALDQARRQRTLNETWPNRRNFEAQLEAIRNVNSRQGFYKFFWLDFI